MQMREVFLTDASEVLADGDFHPAPFIERYITLSERLKLDFSAIIFTLQHVPFCLDGTEHAAQRADIARLMAERRPWVTAQLPGMTERRLSVLSEPGEHDLMARLVLPFVDDLIGALVGIDPGVPPDALVSRIFSQNMGVARRKRLETELKVVIARLRDAYPDASPLRLGSHVAMVVLGRDAMIGTLGRSLFHLLDQAAGRPLCQLSTPLVASHTGVPYIDRMARCPTVAAGADVAEGEVLRCVLKSLEDAPQAERMRFFGAGAHLCLGRALALEVFSALADGLSRIATWITVTDFALREDDVFAFPETFIVRVTR